MKNIEIKRTWPTYAVHVDGKPKFTGLYRRKTAKLLAHGLTKPVSPFKKRGRK